MVNRHRGEIEAEIGGDRRRLVLTLGAMAEIEDALGTDISTVIGRLRDGGFRARDAITILAAAISAAEGASVSPADVGKMHISGGFIGAQKIVVDLLNASFETAEGNADAPAEAASPGATISKP